MIVRIFAKFHSEFSYLGAPTISDLVSTSFLNCLKIAKSVVG